MGAVEGVAAGAWALAHHGADVVAGGGERAAHSAEGEAGGLQVLARLGLRVTDHAGHGDQPGRDSAEGEAVPLAECYLADPGQADGRRRRRVDRPTHGAEVQLPRVAAAPGQPRIVEV